MQVRIDEALAESKDDAEHSKTLNKCGQCLQDFHGPVSVALQRAAWLRHVNHAETLDGRPKQCGHIY